MAEVGVSVVAKLAEYLVDPTLQQLQYLFCVGKISRNVEIRKEELLLKQGRVQERVQEAINKTNKIDGEVNKWKNDVVSLIAEVENLEEQLRANNGCIRRWCPTWMKYRLCKKLANVTQRMIHLTTKSDNFNPFSHPVTVLDIEYHSSQNFKLFNSTRVAFDQLREALNDDGSSIIGLWGMGGSGKTTLVTEVGKKVKESQHFDRVVLTTVSQSPDIRKIQGEIADTLGLELKEESEIGRAKRIALRLQNGERNLIIVDDVWAKLNLEDIGIPVGENHQTSYKVVLTTRRLDVCTLMGCQKMIQLNLLKEDEAWALFQNHAHVDDADKEVVAREIVVECKGLPIAIVAMGTCLKGKGVDEMNVMLYRLRNAKPNNVDKGVRDAFACLELSYDYLATSEAKLVLLMCAMFPEDHKIDVEDLFRYGVGLGICGDVDSSETIRSQVRATIKYLIDSSLLMHFSHESRREQEYVIVHDVVRDFALWKASKEDSTIIVNCTKELDELVDDEGIKDCYAASSWYDEEYEPRSLSGTSKLRFQLNAPKLKLLMLHSRTPLEISHPSFEGAKGLQALIIMCRYKGMIKVQPQSIQWLSNLQCLRLQNLDLCDIFFVVSLTRLEILDLQGSKFEKIPDGIEKLNKLKLLDLSSCKIDECCYRVVGRCSQLQELYVSRHVPHSTNTNCYEFLASPIGLRKLRRYKLEIGDQPDRYSKIENKGIRYLCLSGLNISMLGSIIKDLTQRATAIEFNELKGGCKSFMPNIIQGVGGMNELTNLLLHRCSEIECITDETTHHKDTAMPRLGELKLTFMNNLKQLHRGPYPFILFQKLERLTIYKCPKLLHIFPSDCNLGNLRLLEISNCPMLKSLFPASVACTMFSLVELRIEVCNELKHVVEGEGGGDAWVNSRFPMLKILSIDNCEKLEFVCPIFLALRFVQLQRLSITHAPKMKFMFDEGQPMHDQDETHTPLPLLEYLQLQDLPSLVGIFSERCHRRWPSIKTIQWRNCPNMELYEVKGHQLRNEELYKPLAAIERIQLDNCVAESIFNYNIGVEEQIPTFQYLKVLTLKKCGGLKFLFYAHICRSLPELTFVAISCCEELEAIFSGNEETQKNPSIAYSCLPKLENLKISKCDKLKFILSFKTGTPTQMFPQLSTLTISNCGELEEIIAENGKHHIMSNVQVHYPKLRELKVERCNKLKRLFSTSAATIVLSSLRNIELRNLPNFTSVSQGMLQIQVEPMRNIIIRNCPKFIDSNLGSTIHKLTTTLELYGVQSRDEGFMPMAAMGRIELDNCGVESIFHIQGGVEEQIQTFRYVKELELEKCSRLKFVFSAHTCPSLPELTSVTISSCAELEAIFLGNEKTQNSLSIDESCLPKLKYLEIFKCNKLKFILSLMTNVATSVLPQLSTLTIIDCSQMEEVFNCSNIENHGIDNEREIKLPNMKLVNLPRLVHVCRGFKWHVGKFYRIEVHDCPNLMPVKDATIHWIKDRLVREYVLKYSQLNNTEALNLPLSVLNVGEIDTQNLLVEHNWRVLGDDDQQETNDSGRLMELEQPMVGGGIVPTQVLSFQYLHSLEVVRCVKLKFLFSASIITNNNLPNLTFLTLSECEELEEIIAQNGEHQTIVLSSLRNIMLTNLPNFKSVCQGGLQFQVELMSKINISNCPKFVDSSMGSTLQQLGTISEYCINDSRVLMRSEQQMIGGGVVPTQVLSFHYLHSLEVTQSKKLKFVFSKSTIAQNSLPKLASLTLSDCEGLEVILGQSSDKDANYNETIVLSSLRKIRLTNLPNFKNVCQEGLQIQMELRDIGINNCPKFVNSSLGSVLQQLGTILVSNNDSNAVETSSSNNVNKERWMISRAGELYLEDLMSLIFVWEGLTSIIFQNLRNLSVIGCRRLKCMFPSCVIRSLPCLWKLHIEECEELEEMIMSSSSSSEDEHHHHHHHYFPNDSSNPSLCFPQLYDLRVIRCNKLKWLFPSLPSTKHLPWLHDLTIKECSQLKGLFNDIQVEIHEEEGFCNINNLLPELRYLEVEDCPIFSKTTLAALQSCADDSSNRKRRY